MKDNEIRALFQRVTQGYELFQEQADVMLQRILAGLPPPNSE